MYLYLYLCQAQALLAKDRDWHMPVFWRVEWANVLTNYARHGDMPQADALALMKKSESLGFITDHAVDQAAALELSLKLKVTAYDAQFLALAKHLGVPCVTSDKALGKAAKGLACKAEALILPK
jgi:predicted nucleic acid-binding protein